MKLREDMERNYSVWEHKIQKKVIGQKYNNVLYMFFFDDPNTSENFRVLIGQLPYLCYTAVMKKETTTFCYIKI